MIILLVRSLYLFVISWLNDNSATIGATIENITTYVAVILITLFGISLLLRSIGVGSRRNGSGNGIVSIIVGALIGAIGAVALGTARLLINFLRETYREVRDSLVEYGWRRLWANLAAITALIIII